MRLRREDLVPVIKRRRDGEAVRGVVVLEGRGRFVVRVRFVGREGGGERVGSRDGRLIAILRVGVESPRRVRFVGEVHVVYAGIMKRLRMKVLVEVVVVRFFEVVGMNDAAGFAGTTLEAETLFEIASDPGFSDDVFVETEAHK
jgi:hypothetical protein